MDGDDECGEAEAVQVLTQASNVCAFLNSLEEESCKNCLTLWLLSLAMATCEVEM